MIDVSPILTEAPAQFSSALQHAVYDAISQNGIRFERVENEPAITMEDCQAIDAAIGAKTVKTLFLTNRQQTLFYLFVMKGNKAFVTKDFGKALGIPRVSFASAQKLEELAHTPVGAATPLCVTLDPDQRFSVVVDKEILKDEYLCCPDGTTTCYIKIKVKDVLRILENTGHKPTII